MSSVAGQQERNLKLLAAIAVAAVLLLIVAAIALYLGMELPPNEMQHSLSAPTGYSPPPNTVILPAGSVTRGSLAREGATGDTPPSSEPALADLGKRTYDVNCAMCHGTPGKKIGPVGDAYTPHPPDLAGYLGTHSDADLYRSITEGVRSTPSVEAARYLPQEWHSYRDLLNAKERWSVAAYLHAAAGASR